MAENGDVAVREGSVGVADQLPAQPSSPAGSTSSKEEKNTREKLKKTSIAGLKQHITDAEPMPTDGPSVRPELIDPANDALNSNGTRGRPAKKRSFEDLAKDDAAVDAADNSALPPEPKGGHHKRMRSREIAANENAQTYSKMEGDKTETVQEETDMDAQISPGGPGVLVNAPSQEEMEQDEAAQAARQPGETETTSIQRDETLPTEDQSSSKTPATSGFANTSTSSPFGQAKSPATETSASEPKKVTSPSAFASSGLSAFATTEKSPFGAVASSKSPGGFGGGQPLSGFGSSKGGFGSSSGFGGSSSFGLAKGFGSTFGAPKPFGTGGPGSGGFGTGKPFTSAAEKDEEEEGDKEEDEDPASAAKEDTVQDPRFREQQVDTGEEGEEVHFSSRAKLYFFSKDGGWKERGTGIFKINVRMAQESVTEKTRLDVEAQAESNGRRKARLLMRADATHRVILNSPVFKGMRFGAPDGTEPTGRIMHLQSLEESRPVPLQIKIGKEETLKELYHRLRELEHEA